MLVMTKYAPFDAADYLDSPEVIGEFIKAAAEHGDHDHLVRALKAVEKAKRSEKPVRQASGRMAHSARVSPAKKAAAKK
jgi:DNA-binding phage protein